jgi:hypothetical protein
MTITTNFAVNYVTRRCWKCGTFWAIEEKDNTRAGQQCVLCWNQEADRRSDIIKKLRKSIQGYKAHLKTKSKRHEKAN